MGFGEKEEGIEPRMALIARMENSQVGTARRAVRLVDAEERRLQIREIRTTIRKSLSFPRRFLRAEA
jgi:hypothetical protein